CHYVAAACVGVGTRCKSCPLLQSALPFDLSFWTFKRKAKTYAKLKNLTINGLSRWIAQSAKDSALLGSKPIINLPNPIDTRIYRPIQKSLAREMLRIHTPKKMISFGAIRATSTPRKGFNELKGALQSLPQHLKSQCELLVFGSSEGEVLHDMPTHFLGALHDDIALALLYSASDVFIMPSYVESFGQTALEALSCGTPVVAFDTSGLKDIITHKHNGYLAKCYDTNDLAKGMEWILSGESAMYENLSNNARSSAIKAFESSKVANAYITTYQKLARGGAAPKALAKHILHALSLTKSSTFYIGFGAIGGASVERKGFNELKAALDCLPQHLKNQCELLVFGGTAPQIQGIKAHALGFLHDDYALSFAFNACDIFVAPSLAENLSNVIMESLACGTPVVAFDIGGNGDMITHKHNGYLATNPSDLAQGIKWILAQDATAYATLAHNARESALRFESTNIANTYIDTYKFLAGGGGSNHRFLKVLPLSQAHRNSQHNFFSNISSTGLAA
uniref:glycosyltransferase n=1 Tax=Helicobacter canis TaxID=29419 RepID=UPI0029438E06